MGQNPFVRGPVSPGHCRVHQHWPVAEQVAGHEARHGHDLPAGLAYMGLKQLLEIGDFVSGNGQVLPGLYKIVIKLARHAFTSPPEPSTAGQKALPPIATYA